MTQALGYAHPEPYREYLRETRERLKATRSWLAHRLQGTEVPDDSNIIRTKDELLAPHCCATAH